MTFLRLSLFVLTLGLPGLSFADSPVAEPPCGDPNISLQCALTAYVSNDLHELRPTIQPKTVAHVFRDNGEGPSDSFCSNYVSLNNPFGEALGAAFTDKGYFIFGVGGKPPEHADFTTVPALNQEFTISTYPKKPSTMTINGEEFKVVELYTTCSLVQKPVEKKVR